MIYSVIDRFQMETLSKRYTNCVCGCHELTHISLVPHICVSELIGSSNGLSSVRRQAIRWTNAHLLWTDHLETYFSVIGIKIHNFSFMKMPLKMLSVKWRPFCSGEISWTTISREWCPSLRNIYICQEAGVPYFFSLDSIQLVPWQMLFYFV